MKNYQTQIVADIMNLIETDPLLRQQVKEAFQRKIDVVHGALLKAHEIMREFDDPIEDQKKPDA